MANASYISPREHISFLKIEAYNDNTAYAIKRMKLEESLIDELENIIDKLLKELINLPNMTRAGTIDDNLYPIIGTFTIDDTDIYNDLDKGEDDYFKLILNQNKFKELKEKGVVSIIDNPKDNHAPEIPLSERIKLANKKAKEIIETCENKIEEIREAKVNIPYNERCFIDKDVIYVSGEVKQFLVILMKKTEYKGKYVHFLNLLGNSVYFFKTSNKLLDTKATDKYKRYIEEIDSHIDEIDPDFVKIVNKCIDKIVELKTKN